MFRVATSTATLKIITPLISAFAEHIEIGVGLAEIHSKMFTGKPEKRFQPVRHLFANEGERKLR